MRDIAGSVFRLILFGLFHAVDYLVDRLELSGGDFLRDNLGAVAVTGEILGESFRANACAMNEIGDIGLPVSVDSDDSRGGGGISREMQLGVVCINLVDVGRFDIGIGGIANGAPSLAAASGPNFSLVALSRCATYMSARVAALATCSSASLVLCVRSSMPAMSSACIAALYASIPALGDSDDCVVAAAGVSECAAATLARSTIDSSAATRD